MKLLEIVSRVRELTKNADYAVIGGLAQILWARKTHTDDLDVALSSAVINEAHASVGKMLADPAWALPQSPDSSRESDEVFEVCHLLYQGSVVDLIAFKNSRFNREILTTSQAVQELDEVRFIRPELLLVTHLLRPGPGAALAAVELIIARQRLGGMDMNEVQRWSDEVGRGERLQRVLTQARSLDII
jgi:hypothetical protein